MPRGLIFRPSGTGPHSAPERLANATNGVGTEAPRTRLWRNQLRTERHPVVQRDLEWIAAQSSVDWKLLRNKTVLITGASGFVPAYMVETLLYLNETTQAGLRVVGLVRNGNRARKRFAHLEFRRDFEVVVQDVKDPYSGPDGIDYVVHAASQASPKYYSIDPAGTLEGNLVGTLRMLEVAKINESEGFLLFSSGEVYGKLQDPTAPIAESGFGPLDPMNVRSCYAEGKRAGEALCASWHQQYGIPAKVVRLSHTYGPGMRLDDGRVFADFVADVVAGRNIVMKSDGSALRPFCYLADATIAFFLVLLQGKTGEAYNVGSDREISILELAETICDLFPNRGCRVERRERIPGDPYLPSKQSAGHFDLSKIRSLGWEPTIDIREGFRRTIESYI
ncbi:NAD-dependent epimerase/dehydratase family protein [Acidobacteria bacterium AB60]|nr:NAD-dependent epimerase/dehydratase family protein [Acidobacteria bacterium AB60]